MSFEYNFILCVLVWSSGVLDVITFDFMQICYSFHVTYSIVTCCAYHLMFGIYPLRHHSFCTITVLVLDIRQTVVDWNALVNLCSRNSPRIVIRITLYSFDVLCLHNDRLYPFLFSLLSNVHNIIMSRSFIRVFIVVYVMKFVCVNHLIIAA